MKTLAVDFDGVIHAYREGWRGGEVYDRPVFGARYALHVLAQTYRVVVFTAREDLGAVRGWLRLHSLDQYVAEVTNVKPPAWAYVDDRAVRFEGEWMQTLGTLHDLASRDAWDPAVQPPDVDVVG